MILSVHIADLGPRTAISTLRATPDPDSVAGLIHAETAIAAPLASSAPPRLGRVAMVAAWEGDGALDEFGSTSPIAARLDAGWQARLKPLRIYGEWPQVPGIAAETEAHDESEPVAVLTIGNLRLLRVLPFLRASRPAEKSAVGHPAMLASTGLARPPHLVSTFSLWRSAAEMREFATGAAHDAAVRGHQAKPFHHSSAFIRLRPYASSGSWGGRDPLAA